MTETSTVPDPAAYITRWDLSADGRGLSTFSSELLPVRCDGMPAMLKIAKSAEERTGNALMVWWAGDGAARVLRHDDRAVVLERATGPRDLATAATLGAPSLRWMQADARATRVLCTVAGALHGAQPPASRPPCLVPLERWFRDLLETGPAHRGFLRRSAETARRLLDEPVDEVVLHGDIHHDNVLDFGDAHEPSWKAIDPKGLVGERSFDYANIVCNPSHHVAALPGRLERQVAVVCQTAGLDRERFLRWVVAWCGLSATWFMDASPDWLAPDARDSSTAGALQIGRTAEALLHAQSRCP